MTPFGILESIAYGIAISRSGMWLPLLVVPRVEEKSELLCLEITIRLR